MRLAIFGGTGGLGRHVVARAGAAGHAIRLLVRDRARLLPEMRGAEVLVGDALDRDAVDRAVDGQEAVICSLGTLPETPGDRSRRQRGVPVCSVATGHIVAAMEARGVDRLIVVSSASVGNSYGDGRFGAGWVVRRLLADVMADKERQEEIVRRSALGWTIVRPVKMFEGPRRGVVRTGERIRWTLATRISRADAAVAVVGMLTDPATVHRALTIAG
jgi:uncharacterized protein YbjT (DUF2867 family)